MPVRVLWFRRDLRLDDHPALLAAARDGAEVLPLFVLDPVLWSPAGRPRRAYLLRSLRSLDETLGGALHVRRGHPAEQVALVAHEVGAEEVHVSADFGPYGARRDAAVAAALGDVPLRRTGSPYAVAPGRVVKADGGPYRVFTPYFRAWTEHGWRGPAGRTTARWAVAPGSAGLPDEPSLDGARLPAAGERAARERWQQFLSAAAERYDEHRDRPDLDGSSRLSVHLKFGELHPRTLLADLGSTPGHAAFRRQLAWREFYADVLHHAPASARGYFRPDLAAMAYDVGADAEARFVAWQEGRTGFPFVDAGMRQLLTQGWMHNRVRLVTASFLVKDLHLEWTRGAAWFLARLVDGDLASNQHGWQWVAGTGTDAAPYFRVFNPVAQGLRFDPAGDYVRRHVPELRGVAGPAVHEPWSLPGGPPPGYPDRIVDHAGERLEALRRYHEATG